MTQLTFDEAVLRGDIIQAVVSDTRNVWLFGTRTMNRGLIQAKHRRTIHPT